MTTTIPNKTAKKAAQYLRDFVRANSGEWAEMMRGTNPKQGYGNGQDAVDAHEAAIFLYHETDERFLSFEIPGEFAKYVGRQPPGKQTVGASGAKIER